MINRKPIETPIDRAWAKNEKKNNNRRTDTVFRKAHALYGRFQSDCRIFVYVETMGTKRAYLSHDDDDFPFDMGEFRRTSKNIEGPEHHFTLHEARREEGYVDSDAEDMESRTFSRPISRSPPMGSLHGKQRYATPPTSVEPDSPRKRSVLPVKFGNDDPVEFNWRPNDGTIHIPFPAKTRSAACSEGSPSTQLEKRKRNFIQVD
ncbi:Hypothetical protein R9X50_00406900 [Acrodontium crateriforme]|uniref:MADS-box domain-containing protein n=1 Tax=Acrodontium crateriforme TaxID=150365 RepID=A0AAQ3MAC1_9PEZI|nr:Hypothetical protein R9X50_00406900 [Acrodontium crateriforme]